MAKATPTKQPIRQLPAKTAKVASVPAKVASVKAAGAKVVAEAKAAGSTNPDFVANAEAAADEALQDAKSPEQLLAEAPKPKKMKIVYIPIEDIIIVPDPHRSMSEAEEKEAVFATAKSIRDIGLENALVVNAKTTKGEGDEEDTKSYELVSGRIRLKALSLLGYDEVPCTIQNYDDTHAEMAMLSENLVRHDYKKAKYDKAMARLGKLYELLHPETKAKKAGGHAKAAKVKGKATATPRAKSFSHSMAKSTGQSVRSVQTARKRGETFTDDDFTVFSAKGVKKHDQDKIAAVTEPVKRAAIIKHLKDGVPFEKAWGFEMLPAGAKAEVVAGETAADGRPTGDEEWLNSLPARAQVNRDKFDMHALAYRQMLDSKLKLERVYAESRKAAETKFKDKPAAKTISSAKGFFAFVLRFIKGTHPKDWQVCGSCAGKGHVKSGDKNVKCQPCDGLSFVIPAPELPVAAKPAADKS